MYYIIYTGTKRTREIEAKCVERHAFRYTRTYVPKTIHCIKIIIYHLVPTGVRLHDDRVFWKNVSRLSKPKVHLVSERARVAPA